MFVFVLLFVLLFLMLHVVSFVCHSFRFCFYVCSSLFLFVVVVVAARIVVVSHERQPHDMHTHVIESQGTALYKCTCQVICLAWIYVHIYMSSCMHDET